MFVKLLPNQMTLMAAQCSLENHVYALVRHEKKQKYRVQYMHIAHSQTLFIRPRMFDTTISIIAITTSSFASPQTQS